MAARRCPYIAIQVPTTLPAILIMALCQGAEREDGNDETELSGLKSDSSFSDGWIHPFGRHHSLPDARMIAFDSSSIVQVTLRLPDEAHLEAAEVAVPILLCLANLSSSLGQAHHLAARGVCRGAGGDGDT